MGGSAHKVAPLAAPAFVLVRSVGRRCHQHLPADARSRERVCGALLSRRFCQAGVGELEAPLSCLVERGGWRRTSLWIAVRAANATREKGL